MNDSAATRTGPRQIDSCRREAAGSFEAAESLRDNYLWSPHRRGWSGWNSLDFLSPKWKQTVTMTLGSAAAGVGTIELANQLLPSGRAGSTDALSAFCFIFCGSALFTSALSCFRQHGRAMFQVAACMSAGLIMGSILLESFLRSDIGRSSMPSVGAIAGISIFAASMIYRVMSLMLKGTCVFSVIGAATVASIGLTGLLGHLIQYPLLYCEIQKLSVGLTVPASFGLVFLGLGLMPRPTKGLIHGEDCI